MPARAASTSPSALSLARGLSVVLGLAVLVVGCGSKGALFTPTPRPDAGAADAFVATLEVDCGRPVRRVAVGRPVIVRASVDASGTIVSEGWRVVEEPSGAMMSVPPSGAEVGVTAPIAGD
jgi:hypothetical protein